MKNLYAKLLKVQQEIKAVKKEENNPFFKSKYFDINGLLEALKPVLNANGLVVIQPIGILEGKTILQTIVIDSESGEKLETGTYLPETNDPQKMGSAITYFRRYALQSLFLMEAEDDDGNVASGNVDKGFSPRPVTPKPEPKPVNSNNPF